jgi:hypothetical protein
MIWVMTPAGVILKAFWLSSPETCVDDLRDHAGRGDLEGVVTAAAR